MGMLDHWHPVLLSRTLRRKPVGVTVAGTQIALFRTAAGEPAAALSDVCPHRRLKLSSRVRWSVTASGASTTAGRSTPAATAKAPVRRS